MERKEWVKQGSPLILPALFATGLLLFYHSFAGTGVKAPPLVIATICSLLLVHVCYVFRREKLLYGIVGVVLIGFARYLYSHRAGLPAYSERLADYLPLLSVIPIYFLPKVFAGRLASAAGIAALLAAAAFTERMLSKAGVLLLLVYVLCVLTELVLRRTYRGRGFAAERYLQLTGFLLPVFLCLALILAMLATPQEPLSWKWVKNAWESVREAGRELADRLAGVFDAGEAEEFSLAFGGYAETEEVGGTLLDGVREEMRINSRQRVDRVVYLAGNYRNTYTGTGWKDTTQELPQGMNRTDAELGAMELLYAIERDGTDFSDLVRSKQLTLTYRDLRTRSLFHAGTMWKLRPEPVKKKEFAYDASRSSLLWERTPKRDYSYTLRYLETNLGSDAFRAFVKRQEGFSYGERKESEKEFLQMGRRWKQELLSGEWDIPGELGSLLSERADRIRTEYLALPEKLPERVAELAEQITEPYASGYDKLLALEKYLRTLTYSLTPGNPEEGMDVVDWFLFESKEGYCTHFASAMAVLGRCIGIPTRFVQGYAVDMSETKAERDYPVYGREAHAWAEAYLDGVGWIPLEATPPLYGERYRHWKTAAEREAEKAAEEAAGTEAGEGNRTEEQGAGNRTEPEQDGNSAEKQSVEKKLISERRRKLLYGLAAAGGALLFLLLGVFAFAGSHIFRYWTRYRRSGENTRIRMDMAQILFLLEREGYRREEGETLGRYLEQLNRRRPDGAALPKELYEAYQRFRYREERMTLQEQSDLHACRGALLEQAGKRCGLLAYWILYLRLMGK